MPTDQDRIFNVLFLCTGLGECHELETVALTAKLQEIGQAASTVQHGDAA